MRIHLTIHPIIADLQHVINVHNGEQKKTKKLIKTIIHLGYVKVQSNYNLSTDALDLHFKKV